jgi:hypothetical protein
MKMSLIVTLGSSLLLAACESPSFLETQTVPDRAAYGDDKIPVVPHVEIKNPDPRRVDGGITVTEEVRGTWKFKCPANVTQFERLTGTFDQFSLYMGQPKPNDVPFVVITVGRDRKSLAEGSEEYKITGRREYAMNGNIAKEWTGQTAAGAGFCELLVRRPGTPGETGDVCRVMAVVKNAEQQKAATEILGSIVWEEQPGKIENGK